MLPRRMIEHRHETQIARHPAILRMRIICTGWLPLDWKPPLDSRCALRCGLMEPSWTPSFRMKMQKICFLSRYFLFSTVFFFFFPLYRESNKKTRAPMVLYRILGGGRMFLWSILTENCLWTNFPMKPITFNVRIESVRYKIPLAKKKKFRINERQFWRETNLM